MFRENTEYRMQNTGENLPMQTYYSSFGKSFGYGLFFR